MTGVTEFFATYKDLLITGSWVIAATGWLISNRQANNRERRKETRSEVESIAKATVEIVALSRKYYEGKATDPEDTGRGVAISFEMCRLLRRVQKLGDRWAKIAPAIAFSGEFYEAVTGRDFQSKGRKPVAADSEEIQRIEELAYALIEIIESGFDETFN